MGIEIFTELAEHYPEGIHIVEAGPMFECTGCPCLPLSGTATVGCLDKVPKCGRPLDTHKSVTLGCCDSPASAEIWWNSQRGMDANMLETGAKLTVVYDRDRSDRHETDVFSVRAPITP